MPLNLISILLLVSIAIGNKILGIPRKETRKSYTSPDTALWIIILILGLRSTLELLYSGSSWYFKPLIKEQYLLIYIWYEGPLFAVLFLWPFYQLILKEIQRIGIKQYTKETLLDLHNKTLIGVKGLFWTFSLLIAYAVLAYAIEWIFFDQREIFIPRQEDSFRESLIRFSESSLLYFLFLCSDVLFFPLAEELFFRGYCYTNLKSLVGSKWGTVISAIIFSLSHQDIAAIIPYFLGGIVLATIYERSKSLIPPFFVHALYNVTMFFIHP